jgi:predicted transposase YdaD
MVYLDRHILPEDVVLFLHPRGNAEALDVLDLSSPQGLTNLNFSWRIAKLWEVPAQELLGAGDVGLIPWVPLTQFNGTPESMIRQCRARIDQVTSPDEHENLLAVTQFLARMRYNEPNLFEILGGLKTMIESPLFQELRAEWTQEAKIEGKIEAKIEALMTFLIGRFGAKAKALETEIKAINDETRLQDLVEQAATCRTLGSFRKQLAL